MDGGGRPWWLPRGHRRRSPPTYGLKRHSSIFLRQPQPSSARFTMTWIVEVFRVLSSCTAIMMIISPSPTIYKIFNSGSTGHASILPLVSMCANCHIWMMYGYLDKNIYPIFSTYLLGELISLGYIAIFYRATSDHAHALKLIAMFGLALALFTMFAVVGGLGYTNQTRSEVTNIVGYIGITTAIVLYSSPFEKIRQVLKHRSGVFIPIHMVSAALANNSTWVVYSALTSDWIICVPNVFMVAISLTQISLYVAFIPSTHPLEPGALDVTGDIDKGLHAATSPEYEDDHELSTYSSAQSPLGASR